MKTTYFRCQLFEEDPALFEQHRSLLSAYWRRGWGKFWQRKHAQSRRAHKSWKKYRGCLDHRDHQLGWFGPFGPRPQAKVRLDIQQHFKNTLQRVQGQYYTGQTSRNSAHSSTTASRFLSVAVHAQTPANGGRQFKQKTQPSSNRYVRLIASSQSLQ